MKGNVYAIRFWVDARGRVQKVQVEPKIEDGGFRDKLLERMREWVFYPARTIDGTPVNGQLVITYRP